MPKRRLMSKSSLSKDDEIGRIKIATERREGEKKLSEEMSSGMRGIEKAATVSIFEVERVQRRQMREC
jgi:hypothetical protein